MKTLKSWVALALEPTVLVPVSLFASSHREAPITALDRTADNGSRSREVLDGQSTRPAFPVLLLFAIRYS
jgi:hypothetical protein